MRYKFAREGVVSPIGYLFEKGSIKWTSEPVPIARNNDSFTTDLIGKALDIRRDDDGWITADIEWTSSDETLIESINRENFLTIFGNEVEMEEDLNIPSVKRIKTITLRELFLTDDLDVWGVKWADEQMKEDSMTTEDECEVRREAWAEGVRHAAAHIGVSPEGSLLDANPYARQEQGS